MNPPLNVDNFKEVFVYPKNEALKESYVALLGMMKLHKKIRFYVHDCVVAILEQNGWISDYNPSSPKSKPDRNYNKAIRFLKVLEKPYFIFAGPGRIELCVYDASTKRRITNFDQFFQMCAEDPYMSEYTCCDEEVIFEPWNDVLTCKETSKEQAFEINCDIARMDSAINLKRDILESKFESDYNRQEYINEIAENVCSSEDKEVNTL